MRSIHPNKWKGDPIRIVASYRNNSVVPRKVQEADKLAPKLGLSEWKKNKMQKGDK